MISQLRQIAKIENLLANMKTARFNSVLPVTIDVLAHKKNNQYTLQIGSKEMSTKSAMDLEVGGKYWGLMKEDPTLNTVSLSKLLKKPQLLQEGKQKFLPKFDEVKLTELISKENPKAELKMALLEKLSLASSKSEFMTLTNMIAAINENVFTMVLEQDHENTMFQFKKKRSDTDDNVEDSTIEFYGAFEHLGPVGGEITIINGERRVSLEVHYENTVDFLTKELENLNLEGFLYHKDKRVNPLFELPAALLDITG
jgi:hypothetical protein